MPNFNSNNKKLELEICKCSECPYNYYVEFNDVGFSAGYDWYCRKLDGVANSAWTLHKCKNGIRNECPLPNTRKKYETSPTISLRD